MKKINLLLAFFITTAFAFGQNLIENGDFESPGMSVEEVPAPWGGFKNRIVMDTITNSFAGQVENGDGSLFQEFSVVEGDTYHVAFDYRWVTSAAANSTLTVRVKDAADLPNNLNLIGGTTDNGYQLNDTVDVWHAGAFSFTPPAGIDKVRMLFYKANGNKPLNLDNVSVTLQVVSSVSDLEKPNVSIFPNPTASFIQLTTDQIMDKVEIYNLTGQLVMREITHNNNVRMDVSGLTKGAYIVKAFTGLSVSSHKLIKE